MALFQNSALLQVAVYQSAFTKKDPVFVPPRPFHSLTLRTAGRILLRSGQETWVSGPGQITYVPKGMAYETQILESGSMTVIHFDMTPEADGGRPFVHTPLQLERFRALFAALQAKGQPKPTREPGSMALVYELLALLLAEIRPAVGGKMAKAKAWLDSRYQDAALSIDDLAAHLGMSAVYLRRQFRAAYSISPHSYLTALRLDHARAMLLTGLFSVSEVAAHCGYSSLSYFSAAFRQATGVIPSEYGQKDLPFSGEMGIL